MCGIYRALQLTRHVPAIAEVSSELSQDAAELKNANVAGMGLEESGARE